MSNVFELVVCLKNADGSFAVEADVAAFESHGRNHCLMRAHRDGLP